MFGHVRRLQESVPVHEALRLAVNTRTGVRPDDRLDWKRPRGRPRHTWIRQLEIDVGLTAAAAWDMAGDREVWRAQRPVAGQAVQWVSGWVIRQENRNAGTKSSPKMIERPIVKFQDKFL